MLKDLGTVNTEGGRQQDPVLRAVCLSWVWKVVASFSAAVDKGISMLACLRPYDKQDVDEGLTPSGFHAKSPPPPPRPSGVLSRGGGVAFLGRGWREC